MSTTMTIGILTQWYDPEPGGPALPGALARELTRRGHRVRVVTGFPNYPHGELYAGYQMRAVYDDDVDGVAVRRVALYPAHGDRAVQRSANYLSFATTAATLGVPAFRDVDVLWVYNSPPTVSAAARLARLRYGVPHVLHVMDLWPDSVQAAGFASQAGRRTVAALSRWCSRTYAWAAHVAYITPGVGETLRRRGVADTKLHYAPVWADEAVFRPVTDRTLRDELGVGDGTVVVLYAGALGRIQGIETLVDAMGKLRDVDGLHCVIAGTGSEEQRLRARAVAQHLSNVTFLGAVPKQQMTRVMAAGDVHVVSLRAGPMAGITLPSKVQATLACGKPAVVAAEGDAVRVMDAAGAGFACRPGNAVAMAFALRRAHAEGRTRLQERGKQARAHYERVFSLRSGVDRVEDLLGRARHAA